MTCFLLAGLVWDWPHRLAILFVIVLLTFYSVFLRARWARRDGGHFPIGSLALCSCLIVGFSRGEFGTGDFGEYVAMGLTLGLVAGCVLGFYRCLTHPAKAPSSPFPAVIGDRDLDP